MLVEPGGPRDAPPVVPAEPQQARTARVEKLEAAANGPNRTRARKKIRQLKVSSCTSGEMRSNGSAQRGSAVKVSVDLGAHLLGHVDFSVSSTTSGTAAALGRVQAGEVEQEILANMIVGGLGVVERLGGEHREPARVDPGWDHAGARARESAEKYLIAPVSRGRGDTCMHICWVGRPWQRLVCLSRAWTRPTYVFPDAALVCARTGAPYRCGPCTAGTALGGFPT